MSCRVPFWWRDDSERNVFSFEKSITLMVSVEWQKDTVPHTLDRHRLMKAPQRAQTLFIKAKCWFELIVHDDVFFLEYILYLPGTFALEILF